ncbi:MAG: acetamidase/formamidase family protein [Atribacterota bacterium]
MHILSQNSIYEFSADSPAIAECYPGEECIFETLDCFGGQIKSEQDDLSHLDLTRTNPATGPVVVKGTRKGQLLRVAILDIACSSPGIISTHPGIGILRSTFRRYFFQMVPIKAGFCHVDGISLPIDPMIGVIGVAPEKGSISTRAPGRHGGNLDTREIHPGNILYLPIYQDGALFALGDVHALMGDGEICGAGVEVAARVLVRLDVIENRFGLNTPLVEAPERFFFLYSAPSLEDAFQEGAKECLEFLQKVTGWKAEKLYFLMSVSSHFRVSQLVDPLFTVKIEIPKGVFPVRL